MDCLLSGKFFRSQSSTWLVGSHRRRCNMIWQKGARGWLASLLFGEMFPRGGQGEGVGGSTKLDFGEWECCMWVRGAKKCATDSDHYCRILQILASKPVAFGNFSAPNSACFIFLCIYFLLCCIFSVCSLHVDVSLHFRCIVLWSLSLDRANLALDILIQRIASFLFCIILLCCIGLPCITASVCAQSGTWGD